MKYLLPTAVFMLMVSVGLSLSPRQLLENWRRLTPSLWARVLAATFLLPPLIAPGAWVPSAAGWRSHGGIVPHRGGAWCAVVTRGGMPAGGASAARPAVLDGADAVHLQREPACGPRAPVFERFDKGEQNSLLMRSSFKRTIAKTSANGSFGSRFPE